MATQQVIDQIKLEAAPAGRLSTFGAMLLVAGFVIYLVGVVTGAPLAIVASAVLILLFVALNILAASSVVQLFAVVSLGVTLTGLIIGSLTGADLMLAASRLGFLSSILIALIFLRLVAARDPAFGGAGAFLASQPPSRRYVSLGIGGSLFGVLLNLGGLGLLIEMTLAGQARVEAGQGVTPQVHAIRERRIVTAIVRGFATIAFWSPFGIALNTLLLIFTDLHWSDTAPWGLAFSFLFITLGTIMDIVERRRHPVFPRPVVSPGTRQDGLGMLAVLGHLTALGALVVGCDAALPYSFQQVLVLVVPVYALIWALARMGPTGPVVLRADFLRNAPRYVNEVGIFALAGVLGVLLTALVPQHALDPVLEKIVDWGGPVALAWSLMLATLLGAMLGLHPIIGVVILAAFMSRVDLISDLAALLALLSGWTLSVCLAPLATTATFVSAILDRNPVTISLGWNGLIGLAGLVLFGATLALGLQVGWF